MAEAMVLEETSVDGFVAKIEQMLDEINIPRSLNEIGVPADCTQRIAEKALLDSAAGTNPRNANVAEMRDIIETAITKAR